MSGRQTHIDALLIEDNPGDAQLVKHHLNASHVRDFAGDVTVAHEDSLTAGLNEIEEDGYDVLFLDLGLPETTGLETLDRVLSEDPRVPIIVLTGFDDREMAVQAIQRGAQDYLPKEELDADFLVRALRYAIERHRQEETLRQKNAQLNEFASVVSHDLRNPLNVAQARTDLAQHECDSEHLDDVNDALNRIEQLIDDLLTLTREGDKISETESVILSSTADNAWQNVAATEATLVTETSQTIRADPSRLTQLLENLFRNAVEHSSDRVRITVGDLDDSDGFYIADDGPGIPPDSVTNVFDPGYSTAEDGTGLGLKIVRDIAEAHEWNIGVTTSTDGGARFEITGIEFAE
jgi:signal transduction histidine kinase